MAAAQVESIVAVDETGFFITGWASEEDGPPGRLTVVSPEGQSIDLVDPFRFRRPDIEDSSGTWSRPGEKPGFAAFFELPAPCRVEQGWSLELHANRNGGARADAPPVVHDAEAVKSFLLAEFTKDRVDREALREKHLLPALERLQEQDRSLVEIESVTEYGTGVASPAASVVVTLYRRIDYLEHQLLHFSKDPAMRSADLIYVLDSPEQASRLFQIAPSLHDLYGVPFRVVLLTRNGGYGTANNLGASLAHGRLLLFLNSDVIPDRSGWLDEMVKFHDATPDIGALGPKLIFEDESIQHAGMYFERDTSGLWGNLHYAKGIVFRDFPEASVTRPVPAVTGACLMVDRALFDEVGGLSHMYARGGYEDSDLCLRLATLGRRNWYLADVELYHLEGQVHPTPSTAATVMYATWLQTHRWGDLIEQLMSDQAVTETSG